MLSLINHQPDIDEIYLYTKHPCEAKNQLLIKKRKTEGTGIKHFNDSETFIEYLTDSNDIYKNIKKHNPNKKRKLFTAFDDVVTDMVRKKKLNSVVTKLFNRGRKLNNSLLLSHNFILLYQNMLD